MTSTQGAKDYMSLLVWSQSVFPAQVNTGAAGLSTNVQESTGFLYQFLQDYCVSYMRNVLFFINYKLNQPFFPLLHTLVGYAFGESKHLEQNKWSQQDVWHCTPQELKGKEEAHICEVTVTPTGLPFLTSYISLNQKLLASLSNAILFIFNEFNSKKTLNEFRFLI